MPNASHTYIAIDLKSFYASVECADRQLDPLDTNLVVADESRTEKTICLAVSPSLKAYGISGRARLFEVTRRLREVNNARYWASRGRRLTGKSWSDRELKAHPDWSVDYLVARPRMARYVACSRTIRQIYLKYIAPEHMHVYSIDEVFMDVSPYLQTYGMTAHELAQTIIRDVLAQTGITATAGIGTNLYLCKVAMDIVAKHLPADADGVRIAELDEENYRRTLWSHRPLTDFWRIGRGTARRLEANFIFTMGDLARTSLHGEDFLYRLFGVNAELLIDHAWGWEPCTIEQVKAYRPRSSSMSSGQVLMHPYPIAQARTVAREMAESLAYSLLEKRLVADALSLHVGYDRTSLNSPEAALMYSGPIATDHYGRRVPKHADGSMRLPRPTCSARIITESIVSIFDKIANPFLLIRRLTLTAEGVRDEEAARRNRKPQQLDLFTDYDALRKQEEAEQAALLKERRMMEAALNIKRRFGKNALLKGTDFEEGATMRDRNEQIGGHRA